MVWVNAQWYTSRSTDRSPGFRAHTDAHTDTDTLGRREMGRGREREILNQSLWSFISGKPVFILTSPRSYYDNCVVYQLVPYLQFYDMLVMVQRPLLTLLSISFFFLKKKMFMLLVEGVKAYK